MPAPLAPPQPAPAPPAAGAPLPPQNDQRPAVPENLSNSFDEQFPDDGLDNYEAAPPPKPPEGKPAGGAKPPPEKPAKGTGKSSEKEPPKEPEKDKAGEAQKDKAGTDDKDAGGDSTDYTPPQVAKPSELRNWANRMGARAQKAESKIAALEARVAQMASSPKSSEDATAMAQELAEAKKKLEQYEADLKLKDYERSPEYIEKYNKPYQKAIAAAYRDVKELLVTVADPRDPENVTEREGTVEDFNEVYALPLGQATRLATQKFGDAASIVLGHRAKIRSLADEAFNAVEEHKKKFGEIETQTKAQEAQHNQALHRMFTLAREGHAKKNPELFAERDGDEEGNALLAKGREFADLVFSGNDTLTPQQVVLRDAVAHNRLTAYPRVVRDNKKLRMELEDALATIEQLRGSGPGEPQPSGEKAPGKDTGSIPIQDAFDAAVK